MSKSLSSLLLLALAFSLAVPPRRADASGSVSISFFYDELRPHGDWITVKSYGHCWRPRGIDRSWQPYLNGEWLYTEIGWTWVSSDPWGGDPYHYGTWAWSSVYGWVWIPGTIWAPAWVTWYVGDSDIGWAPVPPSFNVGISGYLGPPVTVSRSSYIFVPATQFVGVNVGTVRLPAARNAALLARARPVTRFAASGGVLTSGGPTIAQVERATQRKIARVSVGDARTKAVPLADGFRGRRGNVIAPAAERAKFIAPPRAPKGAREASPASRPRATVKHEGSPAAKERAVPREQTAPAPVRVKPANTRKEHARTEGPAESIAKPAPPARERHDAPAPRVEGVRPPHVAAPANQAPPPQAAPQGEKHGPDAASPQGKAHEPKDEKGGKKDKKD